MKIKNFVLVVILSGILLKAEQTSAGSTQETVCFKIYENLIKEFALEDEKTAAEKEIKKWSNYKKQCESTCEYEMYLAELYCSKGDRKQCRTLSEDVVNKKGKVCDVRVAERTLMGLDGEEGNFDSMRRRSEAMIRKYPDWYIGYYFYALALFHDGRILEAKKYFEKTNEIEENAYAFGWLALIYYIQYQNYQKTVELYEKAYDLKRNVLMLPSSTFAAIDSAMQLGRWGAAEALLDLQQEADENIVNDPTYKKLKSKMDAYRKGYCLKQKALSVQQGAHQTSTNGTVHHEKN